MFFWVPFCTIHYSKVGMTVWQCQIMYIGKRCSNVRVVSASVFGVFGHFGQFRTEVRVTETQKPNDFSIVALPVYSTAQANSGVGNDWLYVVVAEEGGGGGGGRSNGGGGLDSLNYGRRIFSPDRQTRGGGLVYQKEKNHHQCGMSNHTTTKPWA